jgi:preprotein translocase subunit SecB
MRQSCVEGKLYEVVLVVTLTAKLAAEGEEELTAFIVEVQQAGLFQIEPEGETEKSQLVNVACPNILFPYAREAIDNLVMKAGFPATSIPPVNFNALYQKALQEKNNNDSVTH